MYQIGDRVVYGMHGVCIVTDHEQRMIDRKSVTYLVLEPIGQGGSRYLIPTHNAAAMAKIHPLMNAEELKGLLESAKVSADCWIKEENQRKQHYRELIGSCDRMRLLQMVCSLYRHKAAQNAAGRKCHLCDDNFLRDAEKLLSGEIAVIMGIEPVQALQYLRNCLKEDA